ncbi:MAG: hypothetical protein II994_01075 [Lachnospiraceae bacterium]|nr:hypothetical protein [Lachnospiraceae bacterium]
MQFKKWKKIKKGAFLLGSALLPCVVLLMLWSHGAENTAHFKPKYDKADVMEYAERNILTKEDYQVLFCQTGLGKEAVDVLWETEATSRADCLQFLQKRFFAEVDIRCEPNTIITRQESLVNMPEFTSDWQKCFPFLEDGDILITFCCHFFGWRNGHAGMVVDAEKGLVLEASSLGSNSSVTSVKNWTKYPSVAILRLRDAPKETRAEIAEYAELHYNDLPYRLSAGILPRVEGTQCAHLVYEAYRQFDYDIDSDKGIVVTPRDLFESSQLEVIQIYGMDPAQWN